MLQVLNRYINEERLLSNYFERQFISKFEMLNCAIGYQLYSHFIKIETLVVIKQALQFMSMRAEIELEFCIWSPNLLK
jgi:hypothetical protein